MNAEPTTTPEEREGMLKVLDCDEPPVDKLEVRYESWLRRLIADVEAGERHLQSLKDDAGDMMCDLEDQVKRLEAERDRLQGEVTKYQDQAASRQENRLRRLP